MSFELCELFSEGMPSLDFADGRLIELFTCLLAVSNEGRDNIVRYAKNLYKIKGIEEKASEEAEIVEILLRNGVTNEEDVVFTKDLAEIFNSSREERESWKTRSIGWLVRRLGFDKTHTRDGNGWLIDQDRLEHYRQIYAIDD